MNSRWATNVNNQPNGTKKKSLQSKKKSNQFQNSCMVYNIIKCIQWTFPNIDVIIIYPSKISKSIALFNAFFFTLLLKCS
jgi:hypothetical protein